jgi:hypothetical protein
MKYGQEPQDVTIPMTEEAVNELVGVGFTANTLTDEKTENRCDMLRGKNGVAVVGFVNGEITSVHPYWAQKYKRELKPESLETALTPKEQLVARIEQNYDDYRETIMSFDKDAIFGMAEKIAAVSAAHEYMTTCEYNDTEIKNYLQFENPLIVAAAARTLINGDLEDMTFALDYVNGHMDELLTEYPPAPGAEPKTPESRDAEAPIVGYLSYADSDETVAYHSADELAAAYKREMNSLGAEGVRFTDVTDSGLKRRLTQIYADEYGVDLSEDTEYPSAPGAEPKMPEAPDAEAPIVGYLSYGDSDDTVAYYSADHIEEAYKWGVKEFGAEGVRFTDVPDSDLKRRLTQIYADEYCVDIEELTAHESPKSSEKQGILGESGKLAAAKAETEARSAAVPAKTHKRDGPEI